MDGLLLAEYHYVVSVVAGVDAVDDERCVERHEPARLAQPRHARPRHHVPRVRLPRHRVQTLQLRSRR